MKATSEADLEAAFAQLEDEIARIEQQTAALRQAPSANIDTLLEAVDAYSAIHGDAAALRLAQVLDATVLDREALERLLEQVRYSIGVAADGLAAAVEREAAARTQVERAEHGVEVAEYRATLAELEALAALFAARQR